jgi:DNA-binding transcriptional LysR family regulator
LTGKLWQQATFQTYVGQGHPLYARAKAEKTVPVEEVLRHPFVSPDSPLLGKVGARQSWDGWRDDRFPRRVEYLTSSLKIIEELVTSGRAIAYLPEYFAQTLPVSRLLISGCPYTCVQKIKLMVRRPIQAGWLNQVF